MTEFLLELLGHDFPRELAVFVLSMAPLVELRGGIIAASALGVDMYLAYALCVAGTLLPIPFILLFLRKIFDWMKNTRLFKLVDKLERKAEEKILRIEKYKTLGLLIFVAIPLPGTGAWTGALAAVIMKMKFKTAMFSIVLGSLIAGVIMTILSYGVLGFIF